MKQDSDLRSKTFFSAMIAKKKNIAKRGGSLKRGGELEYWRHGQEGVRK